MVRHVVTVALALALTVTVAVADPAVARPHAAAEDDGCAAHATSFAVDEGGDPLNVRMGCARDAGDLRELADSYGDLIMALDFKVPERREQVHELIEAQVTEGNKWPHLGDWLARRAQSQSVGIYPPQDVSLGFDGELHAVGDSLVMVIPQNDVGATANWWQKWIAAGVSLGVVIATTAMCLAAFNVGAPAAAPVCGAVGAWLGALVGELMNAAFDKRSLGDGAVWAEALAVAFWSAVGGAFGGQLLEWASSSGTSLVTAFQGNLRNLAAKLGSLGHPLTYMSQQLEVMWPKLVEKLVQLSRGVGGTDKPLKVMVVGDSMSQGYEGDWTWRYRLWEWFKNQHIDVDFVGPYVGTRSQATPSAPKPPPLPEDAQMPGAEEPDTWGGYATDASESFDSRHFAVWGRQADQDKKLIRAMVSEYQPDMLLVGLGFNDLGWFVSDAQGTLDSMKTLVDEARAAKPDIDFALANVPQRSLIGGREDLPVKTASYNDMLKAAIPGWDSLTSSVKLVDWAASYDCRPDSCPAAYDGLHPNAEGEFQIAQAYERTLSEQYGIGYFVPDIPATVPARHTSAISSLRAETTPGGIKVTWDKVYGARGYDVRHRRVGTDTWTLTPASAPRFDEIWTVDGEQWEYQVRVDDGDTETPWSPTVDAVAHPKTAPGPEIFVTLPTPGGIRVSWHTAKGPYTETIDRYEVIVWDKDTPGALVQSIGVRDESVVVDDLKPGHHYLVAVSTWNEAGGGVPTVGRSVTVGGATPAAPTDLTVRSVDATTVDLNWQGSQEAAGYRVWVRNLLDGGPFTSDEYVTDTTSRTIAFLFPGYWNFEFCVTAINGSLESDKSNCVGLPDRPGLRSGPSPSPGVGGTDTGTADASEPSLTARASTERKTETRDELLRSRPSSCTSLPASKHAVSPLARATADLC
ncbi:fibronectin type III domain-containing protein [Streptomyces sp. RY43-2]|uniref:Fibronectin type III domain-containing protein n=1 Tax=Streptomyces macrolidinus TaxID=2952607 RepID=A0ABT0ZLB7_9ACTN|nr:fibronectin type III domain-containing protein [Streptomyces macrolidinus]MCN9244377.1 fibronectin type III domain-containing protein [Streptomyces macrolidinus]